MTGILGHVLAATVQGCRAGCQVLEAETPVLGAFVEAPILGGQAAAIGVIGGIETSSDALTEQVAMSLHARARAGEAATDLEAYAADQRQRPSALPVFDVLFVGYRDEAARLHHGLPPQPPETLAAVIRLCPEAVAGFACQPDYLTPVAAAAPLDVAGEQLLIAVARQAVAAMPADDRRKILLGYGRWCARLLRRDLLQLRRVLDGLGRAAAG